MGKMLLLFLATVWSLEGRGAAVTCMAVEGGECVQLSPDHWCNHKTGTGIGCSLATGNTGPTRDGTYFPSSCGYLSPCINNHSLPSAASAPLNLTVVASPANTNSQRDMFHVDMQIQWEDSAEGNATGYEVTIMHEQNTVVASSCGCSPKGVRQMTLRDVRVRLINYIDVQVRTLPYINRTSQTAFVRVPLHPEYANENRCLMFASNQQCTSVDHILFYKQLGASDVTLRSHHINSTHMQVHMTRIGGRGTGVVIALNNSTHSEGGSPSCTSPNRTPPCFIVTDANAVIIDGLDSTISYTANLYRFNTTLCPTISNTHLLSGCGGSLCCTNIPIPLPVDENATSYDSHVTTITIPPQNNTIIQIVHINYLVPIVCTAVVGVVITFVTVMLVLVILIKKRLVCCYDLSPRKPVPLAGKGSQGSTKYSSTGHSVMPSRYHPSDHALLVSSLSSTPSPNPANEIKSLHQYTSPTTTFPHTLTLHTAIPLTAPSPPTSLSLLPSTSPTSSKETRHSTSSSQPQATPVLLPIAMQPQALNGPVLIIYSPSISDEDRTKILEYLVGGLAEYGLHAHCHDTACIKSPCQWMEQEICRASAVLCVCNEDFCREWDENPAGGKIPIVGLLKHLIHATVSRGQGLAKFATILMDTGHAHYIPSLYLQGDPRLFLVTEVEEIARFVVNVPSYATTTATTTSSSLASSL